MMLYTNTFINHANLCLLLTSAMNIRFVIGVLLIKQAWSFIPGDWFRQDLATDSSQPTSFDEDCSSQIQNLEVIFEMMRPPSLADFMRNCITQRYHEDWTAKTCNEALTSAHIVCLIDAPEGDDDDFVYGK